FEMLLLILADGYVRRTVEKHVRRLKHRVGEEPDARALLMLPALLLELGHALQPAHPGSALQDPGKFGVGGDGALLKQDRLVRIDAAGNQRRSPLPDIGTQPCRI